MLVKRKRPTTSNSTPKPPAKRVLMAHQAEAVDWALGRDHPAFFLEMRLGKTLTTIRWADRLGYREVPNALVVAPVTVLEAWEKELTLEGEHFTTLHGLSRAKREEGIVAAFQGDGKRRHWALINYEALLSTPEIAQLPWGLVALDESTRIKNPKAKITKLCTEGFRTARHRTILSGLPSPEGELDFYCQFQFLHGTFMGCRNYWRFRADHFSPDLYGGDWMPNKGVRQQIKELVHSKAFVLRRTDAGIENKKVYETRYVSMSREQAKLYKQIEEDFSVRLASGEEMETSYAIVQQTWLARLAGGFDPQGEPISNTKVDALIELLCGELREEKVVVWYRFNTELVACLERLNRLGVRCDHILGGMPRDVRKQKLQGLRTGKTRVLLAQVKCAKYGVDVSAADTEIYYSNVWSCEDRLQSEDRILHPMKKVPLLIIDLVTRDTVDEDVVEALQDKGFLARYLMTKIHAGIKRRHTK